MQAAQASRKPPADPIAAAITEPDRDDPKGSTLVTAPARHGDRVRGQEYQGVIVYWTRKRREDEPQRKTWKSDVYRGRAAQGMPSENIPIPMPAPAPSPSQTPAPPKPGFWENEWNKWKERQTDPFDGGIPWLPVRIRVPIVV